jgi:hypothetical protein
MAETNKSMEIETEHTAVPEAAAWPIYPPFSIGNYRQHPQAQRPAIYKEGSPVPAKKAKRRPAYKKRQKERRKRQQKRSISCAEDQTTPFTFSFNTYTQFRILPSYCFHPRIHFLLSFFTTSIKQRTQFMEQFKKNPLQGSPNTWKPPPPPAHIKKVKPIDAFWSITLVRRLSEAVQTTVSIRHTLRKFLHRWRVSRLKKANTEDPVLCEAPQFPIHLVDWSSSTQYVFDASTILQDLDSRILHCDGFFDETLPPRNSFTNEPFTLSQTVSIWNQLRSFSKESSIESLFSWSYISYKKASFCIKLFTKMYSTALKLHALRTTMADVKAWDSIDRLFDFIEYQHQLHRKHFLQSTYIYAIKHTPHCPLISEWRTLCSYYYEADIKFLHNKPLLRSIQEDLKKLTAPLCEKPTELVIAYRRHLEQRSYEESDEVLMNLQQYILQSQQAQQIQESETHSAYDIVLQLLNLQNAPITPIPLPILSVRQPSNAIAVSNESDISIIIEEDLDSPSPSPSP